MLGQPENEKLPVPNCWARFPKDVTKTHRRPVRAGAIEFEPLDTNNKETAKGRSSEFWSHLFPTVAEKGSKYHQRQQHKISHPLHPCLCVVTGPAAVAERAIVLLLQRYSTVLPIAMGAWVFLHLHP